VHAICCRQTAVGTAEVNPLSVMLSWVRRRGSGYLVALASVAAVSVVIGLVIGPTHLANISMLYLIAVIATAAAYGSGPAILASVAAFLIFDWFFVNPHHTFTVADPEEWISLLLFLLVAVTTGQLAAAQRRRAREAEEREREAIVLYDVVRLVNDPRLDTALREIAELLNRELQLAATAIEISEGGREVTRAEAGDADALAMLHRASAISARMLGQGPRPTNGKHGRPPRWVRIVNPSPHAPVFHGDRLCVVTIGDPEQHMGTLSLVRPPSAPPFTTSDNRLLSAVASQLRLAAERAHLRREATDSEVLRRTDEARSQLLNAVSHDLRTPLASIIAAAGSLRETDIVWTESERQEFIQAIEEEAQRLNRIVGNLLDLSRIEGGNLRPEKGWYDLEALVENVLGRLAPLTAGRAVRVDVPDDLPPIPLDYVEIDQVLSNLVQNAVKYTPPGTEIEVQARLGESTVQIEVSDRGPGLPIGLLARVFEPFFTSRQQLAGQPRGVGLGLAVVKGLVEAHGGCVWVENRPGGGATFRFTLPVESSVPPPDRSEVAAA
jgi:two-component system, OmpR family, sensor histidine kinase KdpD